MRDLSGHRLVWVWHADEALGSDDSLVPLFISNLQRHGLTGAMFKFDDGGHRFSDGADSWARSDRRVHKTIDDLHRAGLAVGLWGYHYGSNYRAEAAMIATALSFSPDFYVVDWEAEFERAIGLNMNRYLALVAEARAVRPSAGLFHAPLPQPRFHRPAQYAAFNTICDGMMPQIYHRAMGLSPDDALRKSYDDYAEYGLLDKPVYPVGQGYDLPASEIAQWGQAAVDVYNAPALSWWKYEDLITDEARLRAINSIHLSSTGDQSMRRVSGIHKGFAKLEKDRFVIPPGKYEIGLRDATPVWPGGPDWSGQITERDTLVTLDIGFSPVTRFPLAEIAAPRVLILDGDGSFAGYLGAEQPAENEGVWRKSIFVFPDATPRKRIWIEVKGGSVRPIIVGLLAAG